MKFTYKNAEGFNNIKLSYVWNGPNLALHLTYNNDTPDEGINCSISGAKSVGIMLTQFNNKGVWVHLIPEGIKENRLLKSCHANVLSCDYTQTSVILTPSFYDYDNRVEAVFEQSRS